MSYYIHMIQNLSNVTPKELDDLLHDDDLDEVLLDVRTPAEYKGGHIKEAENEPLAEIEKAAKHLKGIGTVYVSCGTGNRSRQACEVLSEAGVNVVNVQGGLSAWMRDGLDVVSHSGALGRKVIPIIRQVMIVAGTMVLVGVILGDLHSKYWYLLSAFAGGGLLFAGVSGICTMSNILAKMPWNR